MGCDFNFLQNKKINIFRPLIYQKKDDLIFIAKNVFGFYVEDPSNINETFKRVRIRNLIKNLKKEDFENLNEVLKEFSFIKFICIDVANGYSEHFSSL